MVIPDKILKKWKVLNSAGDAQKIADLVPGAYPEMYNRALRSGKCSDEVFTTMAKFYQEKAELIKQHI